MSKRSRERHEPQFQMGNSRPLSPAEMLEPSRAPSRPRGARVRSESHAMRGFVRLVSGVLTALLIVIVATSGAAFILYHQFERPGPLEVSDTFTVPKGEGRIEIASRLEQEGVISNRWTFILTHLMQSWFGPKRNLDLKAGEYEFKKGATMRQVLETLAEGKSVLYKLTIPEGLTSKQIVERLNAEPTLSGEIAAVPAEGTLMPDTYRFSKGMSRQELIERMQIEMQRFTSAAWEKRQPDVPVQTIEQAVIFASLVERETGRADERGRVAGVFANRLKKGIRLQSDPTIIYGLAGSEGTLGRPITRADIDQKTPYNTYQIDGLPPGPICNPGRPAIEATLNPEKTNDLYFVADGTGGHTFSETLKEHNAAVGTWRRIEREAKAKQDAQQARGAAGQTAATQAAIPLPGADVSLDESALPPTTSPPTAEARAVSVPLPVRKPSKR